jgi:hypothetical protein
MKVERVFNEQSSTTIQFLACNQWNLDHYKTCICTHMCWLGYQKYQPHLIHQGLLAPSITLGTFYYYY